MSSYMSSLPFGVAMQSASEGNQHNDLNSAKIKLKEFSQKKKNTMNYIAGLYIVRNYNSMECESAAPVVWSHLPLPIFVPKKKRNKQINKRKKNNLIIDQNENEKGAVHSFPKLSQSSGLLRKKPGVIVTA